MAHAELDEAERSIFHSEIEAHRAVWAGIHTEKSVQPVLNRLTIKARTKGLIRHDRVLTADKRGTLYVW